MKRTAPKLKKLYDRLNRKYFGGKLPADTKVCWGNTLKWQGSIGLCHYSEPPRIEVAAELKTYVRLTESTVLHEMVHLKLFNTKWREPDHGPLFQKEMLKLARAGAFRRLW